MKKGAMMDFSDHTVLVTGAATGIGFGISEAFHAAGARVALGDLDDAGLARAAARLGPSPRVFTHPVDVRDGASVETFFHAVETALGPVAIAVANAGIYPNCPVLDMTVEEWDRVMETNMRGVFLTCQAAARSMKAGARAGKIITISSGAYDFETALIKNTPWGLGTPADIAPAAVPGLTGGRLRDRRGARRQRRGLCRAHVPAAKAR